MAYNDTRLCKDGIDIMYFSPLAEENFSVRNSPFKQDLANGEGSKVKDRRILATEYILQGEFCHSDDLSADHRAALQSLFSTGGAITPMMQIRRMLYYVYLVGGPFALYDEDDLFSGAEIDISASGTSSTMQSMYVDSFTYAKTKGQDNTAIPYTLKLSMGQGDSET